MVRKSVMEELMAVAMHDLSTINQRHKEQEEGSLYVIILQFTYSVSFYDLAAWLASSPITAMSASASTSSTSLDTDIYLTMKITLPTDPNFVNRLFPGEELFLGPIFDEGSRTWSRYHLIENVESIKPTKSGLKGIINSVDVNNAQAVGYPYADPLAANNEMNQALTAAALFGSAAGKIYLEFPPPSNIRNQWALSGFWLQGGYFITCAHWYKEKDLDEGSVRDMLTHMNSSKESLCFVSSQQGSKSKGVSPFATEYWMLVNESW